MAQDSTYSREGYHPDWLAIEDGIGGRKGVTGDRTVDIPMFNTIFAQLASAWPQIPDLEVHDEKAPRSDGGQEMSVRIYKPGPSHRGATNDKLPLMVYFHGGGFLFGNLDTEDQFCRIFSARVPCVVVSVDYPHMFTPQGQRIDGVIIDTILNAGVDSVRWCQSNASRLNIDTSKILIAGGSAGGHLTNMVAHEMTRNGNKDLKGVVVFNPVAFPTQYDSFDMKWSPLYRACVENGQGCPVIARKDLLEQQDQLVADIKSDRHYPGLGDLKNFPPAYITASEKDVLRDDGVILHAILREHGIKSKLDFYPWLPHYFHVFPNLTAAHDCMANAVAGAKFLLED